jgi:hypothetical protein
MITSWHKNLGPNASRYSFTRSAWIVPITDRAEQIAGAKLPLV